VIRLAGNAVGYIGRTNDGGPSFLVIYRSEDGGKTWQRPVRFSAPSPFTVATTNDVVFRASSGRIILPTYSCMRQGFAASRNMAFEQVAGPRGLGGLRNNQWIATGAHHTPTTTAAPGSRAAAARSTSGTAGR